MPIYMYEVVEEDGSGGEQFEVVQPMSETPLLEHPETYWRRQVVRPGNGQQYGRRQ